MERLHIVCLLSPLHLFEQFFIMKILQYNISLGKLHIHII